MGASVVMQGSKGSTSFAVVMGVVVGALITGLAVPYLRVERTPSSATTVVSGEAVGPGGVAGPDVTADGGSTDGNGAGPGGSAGDPTDGPATGAEAPGGAPAADGPLTASDVGVTAKEVRVGISIYDIGTAASFGFNFDIGDQRARWEALVKGQNAAGGINGRKIVPDFRTIVAGRDEEDSQAACVAWIKDAKVFTVLESSGLTTAATVCVTAQGATPLLRFDGIDEAYYRTEYLFSMQAADNRILADHARYLAGNGTLKGRTIGVLSGEGSERLAIDKTLVPTLERLGYEVADIEEVPGGAPGAQRSSIAISNFRAAGVDLVIIAAGIVIAGPFVQSADRAGYRPEFALSSFNNQVNDATANFFPDSFDGTIALTPMRSQEYRAGASPPPADRACTGRVLPADARVRSTGSAAWEVAMRECSVFDAFVAGATRAGRDLTRGALVSGLEASGPFGIAGAQDGHFGPGRHDAVDFEREVIWHKSCECWEVAGGLSAPLRRLE